MSIDMGELAKNYFGTIPGKEERISSTFKGSGNTPTVSKVSEGFRAEDNIDIEGFTDKVKSLLNDTWEDGWGEFTMEGPTGNNVDDIKLPLITFDVVRRIPSQNKKGVKSRNTEYRKDPTNDNYVMIISRRWFDCTVEFCVYNTTNRGARKLTSRLESFLESYAGFFKEQGISEMIFEEEVETRLSTRYREGVPSTCIRYLIVLERILVERVRVTKEIRSKIYSSTNTDLTKSD